MLSLINNSFNNRPKGTQQFESVCKSLNVQRFFRFRPAAGKTLEQDPQCLDLARFRDSKLLKPQRFRTLASMNSDVDAWTRQEVPIAIMGYKNKEEEQQAIAKGLHEGNASMRCGYSFLGGMTFPKLLHAYSALDPKYMWMCAMVIDDAPVHLYFDFDASVSAKAERQHSASQLLAQRVQGQEAHVKQEFCTTFDRFFQHTYGRAVDWSGLHWETASDEQGGKFSLHAHVTTEAFVNIQHMRRFMEAYVAYLDHEAAAGNIRWMQHGAATLLDGAVYTPNRVFRLIGCRKLHKTELRPMPSTKAESLLNWAELVFRGMPSLSIDVDDDKLLSFAETQQLKKKRARDVDHTPSSVRHVKSIASSETPSDRIAALQHMFINLRVLGPNVAIGKCQTILTQSDESGPATCADRVISRIQGEFVLRSAWCPNRTKYDSGEPHVHENTPMAFCVTLRGVTISDFCCGTNKKQHFVPATMDHAWSALFGNGPSISTSPEVVSPTQGLSQTDPDTPYSMSSSEQSDVIMIDTLETEPASSGGPGLVVVVDQNRPQSPMESAAEPRAGEPQLNQAETCTAPQEIDLQPSLASIERIVQEQISTQQSSFDELKMQMQIAAVRRDPHAMATCENSAIAMDAAVELAVVSYLNQFWARFLRLGKPWMVQELGTYSHELGRVRWQPSFNSLKDLKEIYSNLNVQLPNYAAALVQLQPGGRAGKSRRVAVNAASLWLDHPAGRRLNQIEFNPQKPATLFRELPPTGDIGDYNLWRGFDITQEMADVYQSNLELNGATRTTCADLAAPLLNHIRQVWCRNSQVTYDYVISWMANMIQKRGKNGTAVVVKGPQGAGKGIVVQKLADIIGRSADHFFHAHNLEDVLGTYTHNLRSSCLAFLDEVTYGGNHEQAQRLKKLVTEPTHIINAKYQPSYTVDSYLNIIIASNDAFVVPCETRQRRFMALEVDESRCGRQTMELKQYYDEIMAVPALAFAHVLYHHDLSNYNSREIHATDFERDQKVRSFGPMMAWWHDCLQEQHIEGAVTTMMAAQAEPGDTLGSFGALVVKDSVYDSFTSFCTRNRRGSTYQITAKNEFWKLLDAWTQTSDRAQRQVRLTHPELKRQVLDANGLKVWARVVSVPSIDECRSAWKDRVVFDSEWAFANV